MSLRRITTVKNSLESLEGDLLVLLTACSLSKLSECHAGESVREDVVRLDDRLSLTCKRKVEVIISVMTVLFEELRTLDGAVEPLLLLLYLIVEHSEHPHLAALKPYELVSVEYTTISVEASEITAALEILRLLKPERENAVKEFTLVLLSKLLKI